MNIYLNMYVCVLCIVCVCVCVCVCVFVCVCVCAFGCVLMLGANYKSLGGVHLLGTTPFYKNFKNCTKGDSYSPPPLYSALQST